MLHYVNKLISVPLGIYTYIPESNRTHKKIKIYCSLANQSIARARICTLHGRCRIALPQSHLSCHTESNRFHVPPPRNDLAIKDRPVNVYLFRHRAFGTVGIELTTTPAFPLSYRIYLIPVGFEPTTRVAFPFKLRSDMHRIPKGASYFRVARPLRFRISHSTGFLDANRRRIRLSLPSPLSTTPYIAIGLRVNRQRFRITVNLSGLTWEDTTASER